MGGGGGAELCLLWGGGGCIEIEGGRGRAEECTESVVGGALYCVCVCVCV